MAWAVFVLQFLIRCASSSTTKYLKLRTDRLFLIQLANPRLLLPRALLPQRNFVFVRRTPVKTPDEFTGFGLHAVLVALGRCAPCHRKMSSEFLRRKVEVRVQVDQGQLCLRARTGTSKIRLRVRSAPWSASRRTPRRVQSSEFPSKIKALRSGCLTNRAA
jgi:hypothetical protein